MNTAIAEAEAKAKVTESKQSRSVIAPNDEIKMLRMAPLNKSFVSALEVEKAIQIAKVITRVADIPSKRSERTRPDSSH